MKLRNLLVFIALFPIVALAATPPKKKSLQQRRVERGRYLTMIAGCHDCHTPKLNPQMEFDMSRALMGRPATTVAPAKPPKEGEISVSGDLTAWYGPWGVSYTANLTPDPETGLGKRYTQASFIQSIRTGKKPEGEPILPPMPWPVYANMTDEDLKSIWAYLRTIKPIVNNVRTAAPAPGAK